MIEIGSAYAFFPGGSGTILEFSAVVALAERGIIKDSKIICFGKQWKKYYDTAYSNVKVQGIDIKHTEDINLAVEFLLKKPIKKNNYGTDF